ncbi:uncharacterized protein LOC143919356 [Arctopsyche grandis]|uniref:uncharacterized protein LOC143919356 n=1 Tax=Arctopsyche grandis TaxID=121162 RepID=UPI00406D6E30
MWRYRSDSPEREKVHYNLEPPLQSFVGRESELEQLHKLVLHKRGTAMITRVSCVYGVGGVGKSELARMYCHRQIDFFKNILVFDMEDIEKAEKSLTDLAVKLNIPLYNKLAREDKIFTDILCDVYKYFDQDNQKCLIVLDNSVEYRPIRDFIPRMEHYYNKPYILITSRSQEWDVGEEGDIEQLVLGKFSRLESRLYIENELRVKYEKEMVSKLAYEMHYFPLAIRQAVSYINVRNNKVTKSGGSRFPIDEYIRLYKSDKFPEITEFIDDNNYLYRETVFTIWNKTLKRIFEDKKRGKMASLVFNIMAYLKPRMDVKDIFIKLDPDEEVTWEAVELLSQYSIVFLLGGFVDIEESIQDVTRFRVKKEGGEEEVLRRALMILEETNCDVHIANIWEHASQYPELIKTFYHKSFYCEAKVTGLHLLATFTNNVEVMKTILECVGNSDDIDFEDANNETALYKAANKGHIDVVKYLASKGARLTSQCTARDWTPLHVAAHKGNEVLVRHLITVDNSLETIKDQCGMIPVDLAALSGHVSVVKIFKPPGYKHDFFANLCHALNLDLPKFELYLKKMIRRYPMILKEKLVGITPLHLAADKSDLKYAKLLLKYGAVTNCVDRNGRTPLFDALNKGNIEMVKLLVENKVNLNTTDLFGISPLHIASKEHPNIVKLLLENGADCRTQDKLGFTPLHVATSKGNCEVLTVLMDFSFDVNITDQYKQTPLHLAVKLEKPETARLLLERGANINAQDCNGVTPLQNAITYGSLGVVKLLIENRANYELVDVYGKTALHWAARKSEENVLRYLIDCGADTNILDIYGRSPLHYAALKGHLNGVRAIVERGGDPYAADKQDRTPMHDACQGGCFATVRYLIGAGLNPKAVDFSGRSPLHYSVECNHLKITMLLIQTVDGIEIDARDTLGRTPLFLAVAQGWLDMVKILALSGADILATNKRDESPLTLAFKLNKENIISFMLGQAVPP